MNIANVIRALELSEAFMSGFEDDESQEGVVDALTLIRATLAELKVAPSGSIQRAAQGFANLVRQHIAASDLEAIERMADEARPVDEDDWGSERQVAAENKFNIAAENLMTPMQAKWWEIFGEHATSEERIDEALAILEGRSASFDAWECGR